jgi:D-inositol-3-phosphate glycosyltransferase
MTIKRIAMLSVHTSPLAPMGGKKTGGMNVYIRELAQELAKQGVAVDIFTRRTSTEEPDIDEGIGNNVRVIYLTAGGIRPLSPDDLFPYLSQFTARLMAFATLHNVQYDVIYSHYWLSGWVAQKLKEAWGIPFVQMFHTLGQMKERIQTQPNMNLSNERIQTENLIVEWADRIIAATPAEETQLQWLYRAKRRKIKVVPPGVNTTRFQPISKQTAREKIGFELCDLLLFVGRIEPLKAVDSIIKALAILRDEMHQDLSHFCFAIVGGNPNEQDAEMQSLQALAQQLNVADVIQFVGAKNQEELPLYYSAATAVVMPSDYESFGMVALEAMASGTPVIASEVGGLAYVVRDGETGYHVPSRDAYSLAQRIQSILSDVETQQKMGLNASHIAQEYAWSNIANQLMTVFEEVTSRRKARA